MFTDGSHLGWMSGSLHTLLKVDHLRTGHLESTVGKRFTSLVHDHPIFGVDRKFNMAARANNVF
jgi:hypothetical protein